MNSLFLFGMLSIIFFSIYLMYTSYYKKTIFTAPHQLILKPINPGNTAFVFDIRNRITGSFKPLWPHLMFIVSTPLFLAFIKPN